MQGIPKGRLMSRRVRRRWRTRLSILRAQVKTITGMRAGGFFVPYDYADRVMPPATPYPAVLDLFRAGDTGFRGFVEDMSSHLAAFAGFGEDDRDPRWRGSMFPPFDGAAAYTMVRRARPRRILEIGSGNSTRFLARAVRDGELATTITCIDPAPRMPVAPLGVQCLPRLLHETDAEICAEFAPDDILFIDSSHIMLPGMDVDIEFNRIFPALPAGVLVHVHDVFLPFHYPPNLRKWHFSEQNALIGWIVSGFFEIVFPAHYVRHVHAEDVENRLGRHFAPLARASAGSIWLRRAARPDPVVRPDGRPVA